MTMSNSNDLINKTILWLQGRGYVKSEIVKKSNSVDGGPDLVFSNPHNNTLLVAEIKENRNFGIQSKRLQLERYMLSMKAEFGLIVDTESMHVLRLTDRGRIIEIPELPNSGDDENSVMLSKLKPLQGSESIAFRISEIMRWNRNNQDIPFELSKLLLSKVFDELQNYARPMFILSTRDLSGNTIGNQLDERIQMLFHQTKNKFPHVFNVQEDIKIPTENLMKIIGELQSYSVAKSPVEFSDLLGYYNEFRNHRIGLFGTPDITSKFLVELLEPKMGEVILDIGSGIGNILIEFLRHYKNNEKADGLRNWAPNIHGIEINQHLASISRVRLIIENGPYENIICKDFLLNDDPWSNVKEQFQNDSADLVISDPPINAIYKDQVSGQKGIIGVSMLRKALDITKPGGKIAFLLHESFFFSERYKNERLNIVKRSVPKAIISLPPGFRQPETGVGMTILLLEKLKSGNTQNSKLFVGRIEDDDDYERLILAFKNGHEIPNKAKWVNNDRLSVNWMSSHIVNEKKFKGIPLGKFLKVKRGKSLRSDAFVDKSIESARPFIRVNDIQDGAINPESLKYVVPDEKMIGTYAVKGSEILFSSTGTIGKVAIIPEGLIGSVISSNLLILTPDPSKVDSKYLLYALQGKKTREQLDYYVTGGGFKHLNPASFRSIRLELPSLTQQKEIADRIERIESEASNLFTRAQSLKRALNDYMGVE